MKEYAPAAQTVGKQKEYNASAPIDGASASLLEVIEEAAEAL